MIELVRRHGHLFKTITVDNGTEFHGYAEIERATGTTFYFATPYHSWERGTNENTNGLVGAVHPQTPLDEASHPESLPNSHAASTTDLESGTTISRRSRFSRCTPAEPKDGLRIAVSTPQSDALRRCRHAPPCDLSQRLTLRVTFTSSSRTTATMRLSPVLQFKVDVKRELAGAERRWHFIAVTQERET